VHGYWGQFLKVAVAHLLAVISPGPDFAMVIRQSLAHDRRVALWTSIGVGTAILVHVTYALLGIGFLLRAYPLAYAAMKCVGAGYLAWIGFAALRSAPRQGFEGATNWGAAGAPAPASPGASSAWTAGFLTNVLNPKATLFIAAIFASVLDPSTPRLILGAFGVWMSLTTMAWFCCVSVLFTQVRVREAFLRAGHWIDRTMGAVFIGLAVALAVSAVR
jgi:threonine/homoserine/homoserine lactone efflux protein